MRLGVVARETHSLHLERGFNTLKRNLSLESRSNIKLWFRVCLRRICHYDEPIIPRRFLLLFFLTYKNSISTIKLSSNHLLKVNQIEKLHVGTILYFYYFGKTVHLQFCSSTFYVASHRISKGLTKKSLKTFSFPLPSLLSIMDVWRYFKGYQKGFPRTSFHFFHYKRCNFP